MTTSRRAAFLDRDGTLIEDAHYLADAGAVRLLQGVVDPVRRLNAAAVAVVVVTNQSGIAQGLLTEAQYEATRARLDDLIAAHGARIDATYHCPHHPAVTGPCDCRKPGTGLYRRAAADLGIDLARSLYVGDRFRDIAPGIELGGLPGSCHRRPRRRSTSSARAAGFLATSLADAVEAYLARDAGG